MKTPGYGIVGMGYIGCVFATGLASEGAEVTGVDIDEARVEKLQEGEPGFQELEEKFGHLREKDLIQVTTDYSKLREETVFICVNTPESGDGSVLLENVRSATRSLGEHLQEDQKVVLRSTVPPGTSREEVIPLLEEVSGMEEGRDFYYAYAPEFVRGGTGLEDFMNPSKIVIAGSEEAKGSFMQAVPGGENIFETDLETAEAVKYFDNTFHALKIAFANEVARVSDERGFDAHRVMDILKSDTRLNISARYLDPGYPFGGPCLEKDIKALSKEEDSSLDTPLIESILETNRDHLEWLHDRIEDEEDVDTIGILGLSYKAGIDSDAYSQSVKLAERLGESGYRVLGYDPYMEHPSVENLNLDSVIQESDLLVVFNREEEFRNISKTLPDTDIIDLHGLLSE